LVFRAATAHFARDLKKGDRVQITGSISYRPFKDVEGYTRSQASIVASFIEKIHYEKQEELLPRDYNQAVDQALARE
jgi:single-stranded DNA-binding protein